MRKIAKCIGGLLLVLVLALFFPSFALKLFKVMWVLVGIGITAYFVNTLITLIAINIVYILRRKG